MSPAFTAQQLRSFLPLFRRASTKVGTVSVGFEAMFDVKYRCANNGRTRSPLMRPRATQFLSTSG